jgi:hypothetical protein
MTIGKILEKSPLYLSSTFARQMPSTRAATVSRCDGFGVRLIETSSPDAVFIF